jgi:hypothetical protein
MADLFREKSITPTIRGGTSSGGAQAEDGSRMLGFVRSTKDEPLIHGQMIKIFVLAGGRKHKNPLLFIFFTLTLLMISIG